MFLGFSYGDICYCLTASEWKCDGPTKHAGLALLNISNAKLFDLASNNCFTL